MIVGILDLETDSLSIQDAKILEIAILLYDTENARIIESRNVIINYDNLYITNEITQINGLNVDMCRKYGISLESAMKELDFLLSKCDCLTAFNGNNFDFLLIERHLKIQIPKIDSKNDLIWPYSSKKLIHLVAEMGCQVMKAHTALADCLMLLDLLNKRNAWDDIARVIDHRTNKLKLVHTDKTNLW